MRFGLNLRGDLAKLGDAEIAARLELLLAQREELYLSLSGLAGNKWLYQQGFGLPLGRGPFHARIFYRIAAFLYAGRLNGRSLGDLHLLDCELKDVRDEIQRRVTASKRNKAVSA
jgi:hypothetical protein